MTTVGHNFPVVSQWLLEKTNTMGHGGWWVPPKQKHTVRYGLAPNAQNPFKGMLYNSVFNTARRVKSQFLFVAIPAGTYLAMWSWATKYNDWLYTKDGRETLEKLLA